MGQFRQFKGQVTETRSVECEYVVTANNVDDARFKLVTGDTDSERQIKQEVVERFVEVASIVDISPPTAEIDLEDTIVHVEATPLKLSGNMLEIPIDAEPKPRVIIYVKDGLVQDVKSDTDMNVSVLDGDTTDLDVEAANEVLEEEYDNLQFTIY